MQSEGKLSVLFQNKMIIKKGKNDGKKHSDVRRHDKSPPLGVLDTFTHTHSHTYTAIAISCLNTIFRRREGF